MCEERCVWLNGGWGPAEEIPSRHSVPPDAHGNKNGRTAGPSAGEVADLPRAREVPHPQGVRPGPGRGSCVTTTGAWTLTPLPTCTDFHSSH